MSVRRVITLATNSTATTEALRAALDMAADPPLKSVPDGENPRTYKQERYTESEINDELLRLLREAARGTVWLSDAILPEPRP